jgi:secretion/DNA translocation related TadE-like protein
MRQRGSVTPILLAVGAMLVLLSMLVADVGGFLAARQQAAVAADAAALAAAPVTFRPFGASGSPTREAARFATANDASLVWCRCPIDRSWETREVEVLVQRTVDLILLGRHRVTVRSRAEFAPTQMAVDPPPPPPAPPASSGPAPR